MLLFPPKCIACGALFSFDGLDATPVQLCESCHQQWLSEMLDSCSLCGKAVSLCTCPTEALRRAGCESFRKLVYYRQSGRALVQNKLIYRMKNSPSRRCGEFLAERFLDPMRGWIKEDGINPSECVLVYVPRSKKAVCIAGTDQAKRICMALSEHTGIPVRSALLRRWGKNRPQKKLKLADRLRNAKEAYRIRRGIRLDGKTVILVDDIVTTGATTGAATRLLKKAGAERVLCLAVASDSFNQSAGIRQPTFRI